jgi:hypothetical protein
VISWVGIWDDYSWKGVRCKGKDVERVEMVDWTAAFAQFDGVLYACFDVLVGQVNGLVHGQPICNV